MQIEDPHLQEILSEGVDGDIVLLGFPHDLGAKREGVHLGSEYGPDALRRFLPKIGTLVNPEYRRDISRLKITDYGNIYIKDKKDASLEELIEKLEIKFKLVYEKSKIPFILGGSKDCAFAAYRSLHEFHKNNFQIISIIQVPDISVVYDSDKVSINSSARLMFEKYGEINPIYFGHQQSHMRISEREFLSQKQIPEYSLSQIRKRKVVTSENLEQPNTQAGQCFKELLDNSKYENIHLSVSLEVLDCAYCPGVSRPGIGGLSSEEAVEIFWLAGNDLRIKSVDISDYNPTIDDYRTGFLFGNLIYYFVLGRGKTL